MGIISQFKHSSKRSSKRSSTRSSKRTNLKRSLKRGSKRSSKRSPKRSSTRSSKRINLKRSSKRSSKRTSLKRSLKRTNLKQTSLKRSLKRTSLKRSLKRTSLKRTKQNKDIDKIIKLQQQSAKAYAAANKTINIKEKIKLQTKASKVYKAYETMITKPKMCVKRTSPKRTTLKMGAKRSPKRSPKRSAKRSAKRTSPKRNPKRSAKRSPKRSAKRSLKRSAKRSAKRSVKQTSPKRSPKRKVKNISQKDYIIDSVNSIGTNGIVLLLYNNIIAKTVTSTNVDPIEYEYDVQIILNKLRDIIPNFTKTLDLIECNNYIAQMIHNNMTLQKNIVNDVLHNQPMCSKTFKYKSKYILQEYINGETLFDSVFNEYINKNDVLLIYIQILFALQIAQNEYKFTHYDLHSNNIILETLDEPCIYSYYLNNKLYEIPVKYKAMIIDFGHSFILKAPKPSNYKNLNKWINNDYKNRKILYEYILTLMTFSEFIDFFNNNLNLYKQLNQDVLENEFYKEYNVYSMYNILIYNNIIGPIDSTTGYKINYGLNFNIFNPVCDLYTLAKTLFINPRPETYEMYLLDLLDKNFENNDLFKTNYTAFSFGMFDNIYNPLCLINIILSGNSFIKDHVLTLKNQNKKIYKFG